MPISAWVILGALLLAVLWFTIISAIHHASINRLETAMSNSSAKLAALNAAAIKAITDRDTEIASLKAQIASGPAPAPADPSVVADMQADEDGITSLEVALAGVGVTAPTPESAPTEVTAAAP